MLSEPRLRLLRKFFIAFSILVVLGSATLILLYFFHFNGGFSSEQEVWADFGSYFSGTVGLLLNTFNILLVTYLTVKIESGNSEQRLAEMRAPNYKYVVTALYEIDFEKLTSDFEVRFYHTWVRNTDLQNFLFITNRNEIRHLNEKRQMLIKLLRNLYEDPLNNRNQSYFQQVVNARDDLTGYLAAIMMKTTPNYRFVEKNNAVQEQ